MSRAQFPPRRVWIYALVGAALGATIALLWTGSGFSGGSWNLLWLLAGLAFGAGFGVTTLFALAPEASGLPSTETGDHVQAGPDSTDQMAETDREGGTAQMIFFAVTGRQSAPQLRTFRVSSATAPLAPPPLDLRLVIGEHDLPFRLPVIEGVLESLPASEVLARILRAVGARQPATEPPARLELVGYRSEGPISASGTCRFGWTFYLVDGRLGLACVATATRRELSVWFHTAPTYHEPASREWIDPAAIAQIVQRDLPAWDGLPVRVRVNAPGDVFAYIEHPLRIADVDIAGQRVRNRDWLTARLERDAGLETGLDDALRWFRGEAPQEPALYEKIEQDGLRDALRTLQSSAVAQVAAAIERRHGADTCLLLYQAIEASSDAEQTRELLHLLAHVPSGLAAPSLQRLATGSVDAPVKALAEDLFARRRRGRLGVAPDPIDGLRFDEARAAMGRVPLEAVALQSSYDVEAQVLAPLAGLGLVVTRRRLLAGEARVLLAASFRAPDSDTIEAQLHSTPLPVPCHVLHVVGPAAASWRARIEQAGLAYPIAAIAADARSGTPYRAHVAALYIAALRLPLEDVADGLIAAFRRGRADANLRKAIVLALGSLPDPKALEFLAERARVADGAEREALQELENRDGALPQAQVAESPRTTGAELRVRLSGPFNRV